MKIGFVLDDSLDRSDGVQQYVLTLGKWLAESGHEVHYLVGHSERTDLDNLHSLASNIKVKFNRNVLSIPLFSNKAKIRQLLNDERFDVLHVQMPYSPLLAGRIIKLAPTKTKAVGTFHILPFSTLQQLGARLLAGMTRRTTRKLSAVISVSPAAQQFASRVMDIKSEVIPNAVDISKFKAASRAQGKNISESKQEDNESKRIVFLGRLVQRKGCMQLLEAFKQLHESSEDKLDVKLIIAGDGPERAKLMEYVRRHGLTRRVEFKGRISEQEKPSLLASADIVALPSISGESFGIVVVEAIASGGGVVVGGNNPGYSFVLAKTPEMLVDPLNTEQFAGLLRELLNNPKKRSATAKIQKDAINDFDVSVVGRQVEAVYQSVIAKTKT